MPILYFTAVVATLFLALRMMCMASVMGRDAGAGRVHLPIVP
jgi:hypothetical protein